MTEFKLIEDETREPDEENHLPRYGVFWMHEGIGINYFLQMECELDFDLSGVYVMEDVWGRYHRGSWQHGEDDDEEWYCGNIRRATEEEEASGVLRCR